MDLARSFAISENRRGMSTSKIAGRVVARILPLLLCAAILPAQNPQTALKLPDFTATERVESKGRVVATRKVFRSGSNLREEEPGFVSLYFPANDKV